MSVKVRLQEMQYGCVAPGMAKVDMRCEEVRDVDGSGGFKLVK
jgi:hypothetical protein